MTETLIVELHFQGRLQNSYTNNRVGWKWLAVAKTFAYYNIELIAAAKIVIVQALRLYEQLFCYTLCLRHLDLHPWT